MFHIQGHTKDFKYIMGYASKRLEMNFQLCSMVLTLFNKVEKCLCSQFVCPSICAPLTDVNVFKFMHAVHM